MRDENDPDAPALTSVDLGAIMDEAATYLAALRRGEDMTAFWAEADGYFDGCPCGEPHGEEV